MAASSATGWILGATGLLVAGSLYLMAPGDKPFAKNRRIALGLDLQGGAELLFEPDYSTVPDPEERRRLQSDPGHLDRIVQIIQKRVDIFGLKEIPVRRTTTEPPRIRVELPGMDETEARRVRDLIGSSGRLELRIVAGNDLKKNFSYPQEPRDYKWLPFQKRGGGEGSHELVLVNDPWGITGESIKSSEVGRGKLGAYIVSCVTKRQWVDRFEDMTGKHIGEPMAIILDGKVVSAPTIKDKLGEHWMIEGGGMAGFKFEEAKDLATILNTGQMPVALRLESENVIGPGLGEDSIRAGTLAGLIALGITVAGMLLYYLGPGLLAVLGMTASVCLILGAMAWFGATLTLPGFAGLILTLGMSVDANILIYERIREELKAGRSAVDAAREGFDRATATILDSNLTTILTAFILYFVGEGPVQGFAITLMIGIFASMMVALLPTRVLFLWLVEKRVFTKIRMLDLVGVPSLGFVRWFGACLAGSFLCIAAGLALFVARAERNLGLDFQSGVLVQIETRAPLEIAAVRERLTSQVVVISGEKVYPYADAEVQSVYRNLASAGGASTEFQVRTSNIPDLEAVRSDLQEIFKAELTPPGFGDPETRPEGYRWTQVYALKSPVSVRTFTRAVEKIVQKHDWKGATVEVLREDQGKDKVPRVMASVPVTPFAVGENEAAVKARLAEQAVRVQAELEDAGLEPAKPALVAGSDAFLLTATLRQPVSLREPVEPEKIASVAKEAVGELGLGLGFKVDRIAVERAAGEPPVGPARNLVIVQTGREIAPAEAEGQALEAYRKAFREKLGTAGLVLSNPFPQATKISPVVASELRRRGAWALILSLLAIIVYIAARFRGGVAPTPAEQMGGLLSLLRDLVFRARFGIAAVVAIAHDVLFSLGACALVDEMGLLEAKMDLPMLAAFLTIIGYSLNDKIVVFDRIRENLRLRPDLPLRPLIDLSANQTLSRTLLTGGTSLLALLALILVGPQVIRGFSFAMFVGVLVGTYSSIYVASPMLLLWERKEEPKEGAPAPAPAKA
ncbi:MAG: protein translocase subunit SecD [Planctomycetales bacterium]|nr:protein translocase subunit SecD [Planctomycetales bacterium]